MPQPIHYTDNNLFFIQHNENKCKNLSVLECSARMRIRVKIGCSKSVKITHVEE